MVSTDLLYLAVALLLGFTLGVLTLFVFRKRPQRIVAHEIILDDAPPAPRPTRPTRPVPQPERHVEDEEHAWGDDFAVAEPKRAPPAPAPAPRPMQRPPAPAPTPRPEGPIATEWARRAVGAPEPGRVKGICSGCGTAITISQRRPIRIACPACGRTRLMA